MEGLNQKAESDFEYSPNNTQPKVSELGDTQTDISSTN